MAYDNLSTRQLAQETLAHANKLENMAQGVMRRAAELARREAAQAPTPEPEPPHDPEPQPDPPPPPILVPAEPKPAPGEPINDWVRTDSIKPVHRFTEAEIMKRLIPISVAPDNKGTASGDYRLNDTPAWFGLIDPYFRFGQERAGHHHTGFINPEMHYRTTYRSQRLNGVSSSHAGEMDASAIWIPSLFVRHRVTGKWVIVTDLVQIRYYKAIPDIEFWDEIAARSPEFAAFIANMHPQEREWFEFHRLVELPHGLRYIAGVTNGTFRYGMADGFFTVSTESSPMWNPDFIDSPDHAAHMAPVKRDSSARRVVDPDFPARLTVITNKVQVRSWPEDCDPATVCMSSDIQNGALPFATGHMEYAEGQEPLIKRMWHRHAINGHRNCSAANLGNGFKCRPGPAHPVEMRDMDVPFV